MAYEAGKFGYILYSAIFGIPFGNQTWQREIDRNPMHMEVALAKSSINGGFSIAVLDDTGGYLM